MWLEELSESDFETVVARLWSLLSVAARVSFLVLAASKLEVFVEDLSALREAFAELLVSSEADLSDDFAAEASSELELVADLEAEASRDAAADLELFAVRAAVVALSLLADRLAPEFLVLAAVSAVVWVRLPAAAPLEALELLDVLPVEEELSLPLVAALSKVVEPLLVAEPFLPAIAASMVVLVLPVLLWVEELVLEASSDAEFVFAAVASKELVFDLLAAADREASAFFEEEWSVDSEALAFLDAEADADREFCLLALVSSDALLLSLLSVDRVLAVAWSVFRLWSCDLEALTELSKLLSCEALLVTSEEAVDAERGVRTAVVVVDRSIRLRSAARSCCPG